MKRLILIVVISTSLAQLACKVDRGTLLNMPFFSVFGNKPAAITSFTINGVESTINGSDINLTLPCNGVLNDLVASFNFSGARVEVNGVKQVNGVTRNDFTNPVIYTVYAKSGSSRDYLVTATLAIDSAKAITQFTINGTNGVIDNNNYTINVKLPYGTNPLSLGALVANFATTGRMVTIGPAIQQSGITINDFTSPKTYTVEDCNGLTRDYTVTITIALSDEKAITSFSINGVSASIDGTNITLILHCNTDLTNLVALFTADSQNVRIGTVLQVSGTTHNDFSTQQIYRVTAEDGSTRDYTVMVSHSTDGNNDITSFSFSNVVGEDVVINQTEKTIDVELPCGTSRSGLVASFTTNGHEVSLDGTAQVSGETTNDFDSQRIYAVEACDGTMEYYTVTVTVAGGDSRSIDSFSLAGAQAVINTGNETGTIEIELPCGTDLSSLAATFGMTGRLVTVNGVTQVSGSTANNFNNPITYIVEACDGSFISYDVIITFTGCDSRDISRFTLFGRDGVIDQDNNTISVTVPSWVDIAKLKPDITITGASVDPASGEEVDFTNSAVTPVIYTVTAEDNQTKNYSVTVHVSTEFLMAGAYAAGYYYDGTNITACLWDLTDPDRARVSLADNAVASSAVSVSVSGGTVYIVGTYNGNACYWKISENDVAAPAPVELDSTGDVSVVDSLVMGDCLYISGTNDVGGTSDACYWKVDLTNLYAPVVATLPDGPGGRAYEMTRSGGIIYIAGNSLIDSQSRPTYWTVTGGGDTRYNIYYGIPNYARTVMLYNDNIYIGGWYPYDGTHTQSWYCYFTNPPVSNPAVSGLEELSYNMAAITNSSIVSSSLNINGNRYIVGQRPATNSNSAPGNACYWLNGTTGYNLNGSGISCAYGIAQQGSDVYITGYHNADSALTHSTACIWKNGTRIDLSYSDGETAARDVFVK